MMQEMSPVSLSACVLMMRYAFFFVSSSRSPRSSSSAKPFMLVRGVFISCDTLEINSFLDSCTRSTRCFSLAITAICCSISSFLRLRISVMGLSSGYLVESLPSVRDFFASSSTGFSIYAVAKKENIRQKTTSNARNHARVGSVSTMISRCDAVWVASLTSLSPTRRHT